MTNPSTLIVCGDVSIDWLFTISPEQSAPDLHVPDQWTQTSSSSMASYAGGAAFLANLIEQSRPEHVALIGPGVSDAALLDPRDPTSVRTFSAWRLFPRGPRDSTRVWRMDRFFGVQHPTLPPRRVATKANRNTVVVIDDANLGFRDDPKAWPGDLLQASHIVIKMAAPLFSGKLWETLRAVPERLTIYLGTSDLRKDDAAIAQSLSWESLATNVTEEVRTRFGDSLPALTVVSVGMAGAVVLPSSGPAELVYDPLHQEDEWEAHRPGLPIGTGTAIAAALALSSLDAGGASPSGFVRRGLVAAREAHIQGYQMRTAAEEGGALHPYIAAEPLAVQHDDGDFSIALELPDRTWNLRTADSEETPGSLARRIVQDGEGRACTGMPIERIGLWMSVDRTEIESIRSLRAIVSQYLNLERKVRPLNVAVFGPPGSGKSFAVKQMCREWSDRGLPIDVLEFNVAQFSDTADLQTAFQRVRDSSVRKRIPLVFWDEFDSQYGGRELGWLARFLAPMQDGTFLDGGIERPIGNAVFVFAGGTHATLESFKTRAVQIPGAKATDFLSRLRGHVDVLGPNPRNADDTGSVLRRALLIRALLTQRAPQMFTNGHLNIDSGVLNALLDAPEYVHGARSIEAIIEMSALQGRSRFERSQLPARHQIALHVDPIGFESLVRQASPIPG